jgi:hypothetical protein
MNRRSLHCRVGEEREGVEGPAKRVIKGTPREVGAQGFTAFVCNIR